MLEDEGGTGCALGPAGAGPAGLGADLVSASLPGSMRASLAGEWRRRADRRRSSAFVTELQPSSSLRPRCGHARRHATVAAQPSTHGGSETRAHGPMRIGDRVAAVVQRAV